MTGETLSESATFADRLSPLERAKAGLQQDELTVYEIGLLTYTDKDADKERRRLTDFLLDAIKTEQLDASGDPDGCRPIVWFSPEGKASIDGPLSYALPHQGTRRTLRREERLTLDCFGPIRLEEQDWHGDNCLVAWMDYWVFLKSSAANGIPKPNWPGCPPEDDLISYEATKVRLGASDADMCGWTLDDRLGAYQDITGRLSAFDWSDARSDFSWLVQLSVLLFSRIEVEHFQPDPDPDLRYLTYREAVERVRKTHPRLSREFVEDRLKFVAMAKEGELNLDLVARDPLARKRELTQQTLPECLFLVTHIDRFARKCGEDQGAAIAQTMNEPEELALVAPVVADTGTADLRALQAKLGKYNAGLQHAERNQLYNEVVNQVRQLWEGGDLRKHSDMANYFQAKEKYSLLSLNTLLEKLRDLARMMGHPELVRGTKKKG